MRDLARLRQKQMIEFCRILSQSAVLDVEYISRIYQNNCENYDDTYAFFASCHLVSVENNQIILSPTFKSFLDKISSNPKYEDLIRSYTINILINGNNEISEEIQEYLQRFTAEMGKWKFAPTGGENLYFAAIRNFLMDLELVAYEPETKSYYILEDLLPYILESGTQTSAEKFNAIQRAKAELGLRAELFIVEFESRRLNSRPELREKITQISQVNISAGYDIQSFDYLSDERKSVTRYIEVKAIHHLMPRFYWTRNEIEAARRYGNQYWLYLVPYLNDGSFDESKLDTIQDPYNKVLLNEADWQQQIETISFMPRAEK